MRASGPWLVSLLAAIVAIASAVSCMILLDKHESPDSVSMRLNELDARLATLEKKMAASEVGRPVPAEQAVDRAPVPQPSKQPASIEQRLSSLESVVRSMPQDGLPAEPPPGASADELKRAFELTDPDEKAEQEKWRRKTAWYARRLALQERFLREYPGDPAAPEVLLEVATWNMRPPEVGLKILDTLGSTIPLDDYRRLSARAQLLAQTNRIADWVDTCRALINAAPEEQKISARVRLCEALIKDGKSAEARQILEDIVARNGSVGSPQKNAVDNARKLLSSLQD